VEIQPIEWGTIRPKMVARDTLGMAWPHGMQTNVDPEPAVSHFNQWTCEGNYISVACDEEMDRQFDALLQETNEQRRVDIRKNIAKIVYDNYYVVPIAQAHLVFAADPKKVAAWPLIPGSVYPVNYEYIQLAR
jgi:ABC-type transport system substrate-binding protein